MTLLIEVRPFSHLLLAQAAASTVIFRPATFPKLKLRVTDVLR